MGVHLLLFVFTFTPLCSHQSPLLSNHVNTGGDDIADEDAIFWVAHGEKAELTGGLELHMIEVGGHSSHQGSIRPLLHLHGGGQRGEDESCFPYAWSSYALKKTVTWTTTF